MEWDASHRSLLGMGEWGGAEIIILEIEGASVGSRKRARGLGRGWAGESNHFGLCRNDRYISSWPSRFAHFRAASYRDRIQISSDPARTVLLAQMPPSVGFSPTSLTLSPVLPSPLSQEPFPGSSISALPRFSGVITGVDQIRKDGSYGEQDKRDGQVRPDVKMGERLLSQWVWVGLCMSTLAQVENPRGWFR
jgi:hypothetical protein